MTRSDWRCYILSSLLYPIVVTFISNFYSLQLGKDIFVVLQRLLPSYENYSFNIAGVNLCRQDANHDKSDCVGVRLVLMTCINHGK